MPRALIRCLLTCLALTAVVFATHPAAAEPAKQGGATAGVLAEEANKPTPGVDAPKVAKKHHVITAKVKKPAAKKAGGAKPVKAKQSAGKVHVPRAVAPKAPAPAPVKKTATRV